jgi:hypothetical protein
MKYYRRSSLTISAKPVGVGAVCQPWIVNGEQSGSLTRIAPLAFEIRPIPTPQWIVFDCRMMNDPAIYKMFFTFLRRVH